MPPEIIRFNSFLGGMATKPVESGEWLLIQNMRLDREGFLYPRDGYEKLVDYNFGAGVVGLAYLYDITAGAYITGRIIVNANGKIYVAADAASPAFAVAASGFSTSTSFLWNWSESLDAAGANLLIGTNGTDLPQKITAAGTVSAVGGGPPRGAHSVFYKGSTFISHPTESRMYHSNQGNPDAGYNTPQYIGFPTSNTDGITGAMSSGGQPIIFFSESIWAIIGNTTPEFAPARKESVGCIAPYSLASDGTYIYFVGSGNHIFRYSYGRGLENIGRRVESEISSLEARTYRGFYDMRTREYWLALNNSKVLVYDELGRWFEDLYPASLGAACNIRRGYTTGDSAGRLLAFKSLNFAYKRRASYGDDGASMVTKVRTLYSHFGDPARKKTMDGVNIIGYFLNGQAQNATVNVYDRTAPGGTATTTTKSITNATLPRYVPMDLGLESKYFSTEIVGDQQLRVDEIQCAVELGPKDIDFLS